MTPDTARPVFLLEALDRQTGGDRALRFDVVRMFLDDCPVYVDAVRAAIRDGDAARLQSVAHKLKGAASYLTASFVVEAAAHLESLAREGRIREAPAGLERLDAAVAQLVPELRKVEP
jgi:two-component system, sensor histidine kinase and response regulator